MWFTQEFYMKQGQKCKRVGGSMWFTQHVEWINVIWTLWHYIEYPSRLKVEDSTEVSDFLSFLFVLAQSGNVNMLYIVGTSNCELLV